jgi:hypothetical protein
MAWMKHKRAPSALAVPVATAHFFALLPPFKRKNHRPSAVGRTSKPVLIARLARLHLPIWPGRTLWELTRLPNTIYARAGNTFGKKWLADYFNVEPRDHASPAIDESKLTPLDRQNAKAIAKYDASLSGNQLRACCQT